MPRNQKPQPVKNILAANRGSILSFDLSRLKLSREALNDAVIIFPGESGPVPCPALVKNGSVSAVIPDEAENGFVVLVVHKIPLKTSKKRRPLAWARMKDGLCLSKSGKSHLAGLETAQAVILGYLTLICPSCTIICPTGALAANPWGECVVDPVRCIGQKYVTNRMSTHATPDGRQVFDKVLESQCWQCFQAGETVSSKCHLRRLRKVAYNSGVCCGNCTPSSRVLGLNLIELCQHGAVTIASGTAGQYYSIDPSLCTGCMECFNNIVCYNNMGGVTMKMVAYADLQQARFFFTIKSIKLLSESIRPGSLSGFPSQAYLQVQSEVAQTLILVARRDDFALRIQPIVNNTAFCRRLSLALLADLSAIPQVARIGRPLFPLPVRYLVFPPYCQEGSLWLVRDRIRIDYSIHE